MDLIRNTGLRWLWVAAIAIGLDQWTKQLVIGKMALYESIAVLPFFNLTYVRNYGAAFSFLSDAGGWQRWFFTAIAVAVSGAILWWLRQAKRSDVILPLAFSLILGGALGNVFDRIVYGYVIDFLDVYYGTWHWPAFNVADSAIFLGALLLIVDLIKNGERDNDADN